MCMLEMCGLRCKYSDFDAQLVHFWWFELYWDIYDTKKPRQMQLNNHSDKEQHK